MSKDLSFKNKIRRLTIKLGIKKHLMPIYEIINKRKTKKAMSLYNAICTKYGLNETKRDVEVTVSFTTYPDRINSAVYVADAMLRQTFKPDRIIMVLSSNDYKSTVQLPKDFINLEKRGLTVVIIDEDLRSHNKYRYAMQNYSEGIIITVDDDILYPENLIEQLYESYKKYPTAISSARAHRIMFYGDKLLPYNDWIFESTYTFNPAFDLIALGVSGVLYPPNCFEKKHELLLDSKAVMEVSLYADDLWLKIIELLCSIPVVLAYQKPPDSLLIPSSQKTSLHIDNVDNNRNDTILRDSLKYLNINDNIFREMTRFGTKEKV
ncbi:MAG: glycosyltransferase family 2 protein [Oscillospiraceae bacterium]|jgi:hypothetical protein|nr:glycosyltransferase family 2 protein [Oscillospiraceae bacterium]